MRSVDENKAALLELGSSPAMWRMLETMAPPIRRIRAVADSQFHHDGPPCKLARNFGTSGSTVSFEYHRKNGAPAPFLFDPLPHRICNSKMM